MPTGDTERTRLASERTQLAWWRTGLAAMAVSLGVGRVVPAIDDSSVQWPYTIVGVAFALYGIALFWYGNVRGAGVREAVDEGGFSFPSPTISMLMGGIGGALGLATAIVVIAV